MSIVNRNESVEERLEHINTIFSERTTFVTTDYAEATLMKLSFDKIARSRINSNFYLVIDCAAGDYKKSSIKMMEIDSMIDLEKYRSKESPMIWEFTTKKKRDAFIKAFGLDDKKKVQLLYDSLFKNIGMQ